MNTKRLLPSRFFHCGNKKLAPWVNNSDSKQHWLMQQLLKICSDCQLSRVAVQFGTKLFILFAFAQAVLPSLTAVGGGMMKNHSDRRFQNVDTLWCRRPTLWTWWRDYRSLYPLPSENYLLRSRRGPTTHNKGNLRLSPFSLTPSELNPIYIQTETSPPFSARGIHTCWYRYSLPSMLCIWPLSVSEEETEKSTLENLSWTAGCLVKHVTPWITAEQRQKKKKEISNLRIDHVLHHGSEWQTTLGLIMSQCGRVRDVDGCMYRLHASQRLHCVFAAVTLFTCVFKCVAVRPWFTAHRSPSHFALFCGGLIKTKSRPVGASDGAKWATRASGTSVPGWCHHACLWAWIFMPKL